MSKAVRIAFERRVLTIPLSHILPLKAVPSMLKKSVKYQRIAASIAEVGVIEPLVVARPKGRDGQYVLLDGHMRHIALSDLGVAEVCCLVANDDEAFTYNKRINRLSTIYEHFMIVQALERGVSEERLARALNVNCQHIRRRQTLLDGICTEVVDMLKDKTVNPATFETLRKMKPMRQIEAAELMCASANFTGSYAKALLAGSRQQDLVKPDKPKKVGGLTPDQMARMEREMETVQRDFKAIEASYGDDVLHLVIATTYLAKLIGNAAVTRYLAQHHPEILEEFRSLIAGTSLDQASAAA